jgi:pyruvate,water dikinase
VPAPGEAARAPDGRRYLQGIPVSGGVVEGRVRRAERLEDALGIAPDEILLARAASPAWTPVFFLAKGVLLDIGGMLSHCAVVAREYGIPCVVGAKNATALLADGDRVVLDANTGRVYLPEPPPAA